MNHKKLREGFSTGTTAAAAAIAALSLALRGHAPACVFTPLPPFREDFHGLQPGSWAELPVSCAGYGAAPDIAGWPLSLGQPLAFAGVVKDGGDDPDATNGALIYATFFAAELASGPAKQNFIIEGGHGVGRASLPGLPIDPGQAAINPVPKMQILFALEHALAKFAGSVQASRTFGVMISVPEGEKIAIKTLNPRLGIRGGISILGTQGTVRPFSHAAWAASIAAGLKIACGCQTVCLSSGRRSEKLLMALYPEFSERHFIQAGDMVAYALQKAAAMGFKKLIWGCFFGKLCKLAQNLPNTHADRQPLDINFLAKLCDPAAGSLCGQIAACATAQAALEIILTLPRAGEILTNLARLAKKNAENFAGAKVAIHLFHLDGRLLVRL